jgi:hypothetical protein
MEEEGGQKRRQQKYSKCNTLKITYKNSFAQPVGVKFKM